MLNSVNEMIPAGLFPWNKIRLEPRRESKNCEWNSLVGSCLTADAMSEISPVPHAGQCEGEIWDSSQAAEQGKLGAGKDRSYLGPAETEQIKEGAKL